MARRTDEDLVRVEHEGSDGEIAAVPETCLDKTELLLGYERHADVDSAADSVDEENAELVKKRAFHLARLRATRACFEHCFGNTS